MATYGYTFQSGDGVTPTRLNDARTVSDIVNADIKSDAAITHSKLANITAGQVLLGNASNVPTATTLTGDVTVTSGGVTAIGSAKVLPAMLSQPYTLAPAQNSTSGTSIDFTGIPSWAKRITVMFSEVSTNGTNSILVQLGDSGGFEATGYISSSNSYNTSNATAGANRTDGFVVFYSLAAHILTGHMSIVKIEGNSWVASHAAKHSTTAVLTGGGSKSLSDTLTQIRITTVGGTDTFDAGKVSISYEG